MDEGVMGRVEGGRYKTTRISKIGGNIIKKWSNYGEFIFIMIEPSSGCQKKRSIININDERISWI